MRQLSFLLTLFFLAGRFGYGFSSISKTPSSLVKMMLQHSPTTAKSSQTTTATTTTTHRIGTATAFLSSAQQHHVVPPGVVRVVHHQATLGNTRYRFQRAVIPRGGGGPLGISRAPFSTGTKCPMRNTATILGSLYGTFGVLYNLSKAVRRVIPIALEPFTKGAPRPLTQFELAAYIVTVLWFAYVEGYRGFQNKLSPLVVKRSFTLIVGQSHPLHFLLAPYYSLGLFHATKRRMITSWAVTVGIAGIVFAVKRFPYPWRNIIDAGVVAGLTWGSLSMLVFYIRSWITGSPPDIDPALPPIKITSSTTAPPTTKPPPPKASTKSK